MIRRLFLVFLSIWVALPAWGGMDFDSADSDIATTTAASISAAPASVSMWVWMQQDTANQTVFSIGDDAAVTLFALQMRGADTPQVVRQTTAKSGSCSVSTSTTTEWSINSWHHICSVWASSTSRKILLDGGGKGSSTTTCLVTGLDWTTIGAWKEGVNEIAHADMIVGEIALYNRALSDNECAELAKMEPPCRPHGIQDYWPAVRESGVLRDVWNDFRRNLTLTGTSPADSHPPVQRCG